MTRASAKDALAKMREAVEWTRRNSADVASSRAELARYAWVALLCELENVAGESHGELMPTAAFPDAYIEEIRNRDSAKDHGEAGEGR